ncbi:MAG TPA: glutamate--tRNA ligase [Dehalococcoidales bacterium]|nr:glutamate--tRNA ligase [Dehalococcoidales bacterium]
MNNIVRTRYAPSPTGSPHIGNTRSALFAWLFARHNNGVFILRIEDTDVERKVEGSIEKIMEGLEWMGLDWDEGPRVGGKYGSYFQSERLDLYAKYSKQLVESGHAYYCYCSEERLTAMREEQIKRKLPPGYDRHCRNLTPEARQELEARGIKPVVRFKTPLSGKTSYHDEIWGDVSFDNTTIDDFILLKSDGFPTYHLANVVDDHFMEVTHVLRAEEWISSVPRHIMLYQALQWQPPVFAHLPMVLGPDRSKLSKRHGATSILEFRDQGYLPEAVINFLALVGWSLDDKTELFTREELIKAFSIERVSKVAAIFNHEKLKWMNGVYMRKLTPDEFTRHSLPFLKQAWPEVILSTDYVKKVLPLVQERTKLLTEVPSLTHYFFLDDLKYDAAGLVSKGMDAAGTRAALVTSLERLKNVEFTAASLEPMLRALAEELKLKAGQLFGSLRTAVSGETATPPLFQMMEVLGKEKCLHRIQQAIDLL